MIPGSVQDVAMRKIYMSASITKNMIGRTGVTSALALTTKMQKGIRIASVHIWI